MTFSMKNIVLFHILLRGKLGGNIEVMDHLIAARHNWVNPLNQPKNYVYKPHPKTSYKNFFGEKRRHVHRCELIRFKRTFLVRRYNGHSCCSLNFCHNRSSEPIHRWRLTGQTIGHRQLFFTIDFGQKHRKIFKDEPQFFLG